jgi:signal transduction histidine kinase
VSEDTARLVRVRATASRRWRAELTAARSRFVSGGRSAMVRDGVLAAAAFPAAFVEGRGPVLDALAGVVFAAALLARRVWPGPALLAACCVPTVPLATLLAMPVLAYGAGMRIGSTRAKLAVAGASSVLASVSWFFAGDGSWQVRLGAAVVSAVLLLVLPAAVGVVVSERRSHMTALEERNAVLEQAHRLGTTQARLQERTRIAGEMHDLLGHRLSLITLYAGAMEMRSATDAPGMSKEATLVRTTARTALDELRQILGVLRVDSPPQDAEGPDADVGTRADVTALVEASRRAGLRVDLDWTGEDLAGATPGVRRAVHRVVREALTNAHKHAPDSLTSVRVERDAEEIRVEATSLGPVAPRGPGSRMGLVGLEERVRLAGGTFSAGPAGSGDRFVLAARLPATVPALSPASDAAVRAGHVPADPARPEQGRGAPPDGHRQQNGPYRPAGP